MNLTLKLGVLALVAASVVGGVASADTLNIACNQTKTSPQASCNGTVSLSCDATGARITFNLSACHYYYNRGDNTPHNLYQGYSYTLPLNQNPAIKMMNTPYGVSNTILYIDTHYSPGLPPPPSDGGGLPPPPVDGGSTYTGLDQPRAYYNTNVFLSNSKWIPLVSTDKLGCGGFAGIFAFGTVSLQGVQTCTVGDVYDVNGNLLQLGAVTAYGSTVTNLSRFGLGTVILKLHSADYYFGNKVTLYLNQ